LPKYFRFFIKIGFKTGQFLARSREIIHFTGIEMKALFAVIVLLAAIPIKPFAKTAGYSISLSNTAPLSSSQFLKISCLVFSKAS
jgi:hypothetical protein